MAVALLLDLVDAPRRPRVDRRVDVTEGPLVGRKLAVRVHVPFAQQQHQLRLREVRIDERQRHAVEREIPGGIPGVLPLVRHRDDVRVVEVVHSWLRPSRRCAGGAGCAGSPSSQSRTT